jgi:2-hydroxychromene-2-carboxylate isomerase
MNLEFVFDYRSPYAYLANTQIWTPGVYVDYKPIDILAVMKKVNNHPTPLCPPKARYARIDAQRWAKHYGVAFSPNGALLQAMRDGQLDGMLLLCAALAARELVFQVQRGSRFARHWRKGWPFASTTRPRTA